MKFTLLIDADVLRYQMAFKNTVGIDWDGDGEKVEAIKPEKAKRDMDDFIESLMDKFGADDYLLPLSDPKANFRKPLFAPYKENRSVKPKPALWYEMDKYLQEFYSSRLIIQPRLEGDDILGLLATHPSPKRCPGKRLVISIDKDLQTIPCRLYNPGKPDIGVRTITQHDADLFWMKQVLTGDTVDNYPGLRGVGQKRADELLMPVHEDYLSESAEDHLHALWLAVVGAYEDRGQTEEDAIVQAQLARILRHGDYLPKTNHINLWRPK